MIRKVLVLLLSLGINVILTGSSFAIVQGDWDVSGTMTLKISVQGYGATTGQGVFIDEFVFFENGTFQMINLAGMYTEKGTSFVVVLNPADMEITFEEMLSDILGVEVDVESVASSFKGKIDNTTQTISGKLKQKLSFSLHDYGLYGKAKISGVFIGARIQSAGLPSVDPGLAAQTESSLIRQDSLVEMIGGKILEAFEGLSQQMLP